MFNLNTEIKTLRWLTKALPPGNKLSRAPQNTAIRPKAGVAP